MPYYKPVAGLDDAMKAGKLRYAKKQCDKVPEGQKKENYYCRQVNQG